MKNDFDVWAAYHGENETVIAALKAGADVNETDKETGLSALHMAIGTNNMALTKSLVEEFGAGFFADKNGRWPSYIATDSQVSDELSDYVVHAEARFLGLDA